MSVRIMPPHLVSLAWCRITTFAHVGHTLRLIPSRSSQLFITLVMSCKFYVMLEQHACLPPNARSEVNVVFRTVSLRGLSRFHLCFLGGWLISRLAQSMHTPSAAESLA